MHLNNQFPMELLEPCPTPVLHPAIEPIEQIWAYLCWMKGREVWRRHRKLCIFPPAPDPLSTGPTVYQAHQMSHFFYRRLRGEIEYITAHTGIEGPILYALDRVQLDAWRHGEWYRSLYLIDSETKHPYPGREILRASK